MIRSYNISKKKRRYFYWTKKKENKTDEKTQIYHKNLWILTIS